MADTFATVASEVNGFETNQWTVFSAQGLKTVGETLKPISATFQTLTNTLNQSLEVLISILDVLATISLDEISLTELAIKGGVASIKAILSDFTSACAMHSLVVPLGNHTNQSIAGVINASLDDLKDPLRPMYGPDDYVAGLMMVYGAPDIDKLIELLVAVTNLQKLLGEFGTNLDDNLLTPPKNLQLKAIATPRTVQSRDGDPNLLSWGGMSEVGAGPISILLSWEPKGIDSFLDNINVGIRLTKIRIYKSKQNFSPTATDDELARYQIAEFPYSGKATYVDRNIMTATGIESGTNYYAVGYRLAVDLGEELPAAKRYFALPFTLVSSVKSVNIGQVQKKHKISASTTGVVPDWQALGSPFQLLPPLLNAVDEITIFVEQLDAGFTGAATQLKKLIKFLREVVQKNVRAAEKVIRTLNALIQLLLALDIGADVMVFEGKGGNGFIKSTVSSALLNKSTLARPKFDAVPGQKISPYTVGGIALVAGAATPGAIESAQKLFKMLGGSGGFESTAERGGAALLANAKSLASHLTMLKEQAAAEHWTNSFEYSAQPVSISASAPLTDTLQQTLKDDTTNAC